MNIRNSRWMICLSLIVGSLSFNPVPAQAQGTPSWPSVTREMKPGARWWWMGSAVDEANLRWSIGEYANAGIGTLEITPIYGVQGNNKNNITYLSSQWLDALKTCQQAGDDANMDIDMNGGTGWPFGGPRVTTADAAGKLVTKTDVLTSDGSTPLSYNIATSDGGTLQKVMAYPQDGTDGEITDVTDKVDKTTLTWTAPAGSWRIIAVYCGHTGQQVKRAAPGGEGLVLDHYSASAVKNYLDYFDRQFNTYNARWPHSFFNDSYEVYGADWTPLMFEEFLKYRSYKLEDHMPELLGLAKDTNNQVIADYRQTLSDMLLNNFTRQWTDWAHSHGITTRNQGHGSPGNLIDFYAAVDIPEIEGFGITDFKISGLRTDPGFTSQNLSDLATLKYASSAAHVTGKQLTSSETFTWLAEHFRVSLSQMKPEMDLMFIAGVNHIFFHGTTYSPREAAWPGWKFYASIDMSPTNSIWRDAPALMTYATRCQSFLQMGSPDNDILVYAPFQDAMHKNTGANAARLQLFDINTLSQKIPSMPTAVKNIEAAGLDCDFISDQLLLGVTYTDGMLQTAAGTRYHALLVPVKTNMPTATQEHIDALAAQGAKIIYQSDAATLYSTGATGEDMRSQLGLRSIRRKNDTGYHYFISNLSSKTIEGNVSLAVPFASAVLFNPMTGSIREASVSNGKVWLSLRSGESVILQTYNNKVSSTIASDEPSSALDALDISSPWMLSFADDAQTMIPLGNSPKTWETIDGRSDYMGTGIYETTFTLSQQALQMCADGARLDLGDVRESARVWLNGDSLGTVWAAPFTIDVTGRLKTENTLRIEVTNLPANKIRQMDIDGKKWRIFEDVNILDIVDGNTSQSGITYEKWTLVPSGLNSMVRIVPLKQKAKSIDASLVSFSQDGDAWYPVFRLSSDGKTISPTATVSLTRADGSAFTDYSISDDRQMLTIKGGAEGHLMLTLTDGAQALTTYIAANGGYERTKAIDFTTDQAPECGWQDFTSNTKLQGFTESVKPWHRAIDNGKEVTTLYNGITFASEKSTYYFYYPTFGLAGSNAFEITMPAQQGDVAVMAYMQGTKDGISYNAADSLTTIDICRSGETSLTFSVPSRADFVVCRSLSVFRPLVSPTAVERVSIVDSTTSVNNAYYTLQGTRTLNPRRGLYIRGGRKVIVK